MALLGYVSSPVKRSESLSLRSNFVGGTINFPVEISEKYLICPVCFDKLCFLMNLHCPLEFIDYERSFHVFTCLKRDCQKTGKCWRVLRNNSPRNPVRVDRAHAQLVSSDWRLDSSSDEDSEVIPARNTQNKQENVESTFACTTGGSFQCHYIDVFEDDTKLNAHSIPNTFLDADGIKVNVNDLSKTICADSESISHSTLQGWVLYDKIEQEFEAEENIDVRDDPRDIFSGGLKNHIASRGDYGCEVVRYWWSGRPVFNGPVPDDLLVPHMLCSHCFSSRVFEFQLFPSLNNFLRCNTSKSGRTGQSRHYLDAGDWLLDMATVIVLSCSKSCSPTPIDRALYCIPEFIVVQMNHGEIVLLDE